MANQRYILICGGAGYIGSHVVQCMAQRGLTPVVLDDLSTGHRSAVADGVELISASLADRAGLDRALESHDFEAVVHLCGNISVGESVANPGKYYRNNVVNGLNLLEAMVDHGVLRIVFSSSAAVYGYPETVPIREDFPLAPISPYGRTKLMFEQMLGDFDVAHGLKSVSLRYFNAAGAAPEGRIGEDHDPESHLIPLVLRRALHAEQGQTLEVYGDDYDTPDGTCVRDYIHVLDLADAHIRAADYLAGDGQSVAVNLGNDSGFSVLEIIEACRRVTGLDIPHRVTSRRAGDPAKLVSDTAMARDVLGWRPEHSDIDNIISTAWNWHSKHPAGFDG